VVWSVRVSVSTWEQFPIRTGRHLRAGADRRAGTFGAVKPLLNAYRVLATVVGVSIIVLVVIGVPLKYVHAIWPDVLPVGSNGWQVGSDINLYLGTAHGFIYMAFVLVAFMLALRARWPVLFTIVTLVCGTIPFLSFWAEFRAIRKVRDEHPEVATGPATSTGV
jgi:integral membrane protein